MHRWHVYPSKEETIQAVTDFLANKITDVLDKKPACYVALPGGNTPAPCLQKLAGMSFPWERIHWYLGDERCFPVGHPERNDTMIRNNFWSSLRAPEENFHVMPTELGPEKAAEIYAKTIDAIGALDIAFLGMGEDGHTASLFPGNAALTLEDSAVPVFNAPKPPPERVSLSRDTLKAAGTRIVLTMGASKQDAIQQIKDAAELPINTIGDIDWYVDTQAIGT